MAANISSNNGKSVKGYKSENDPKSVKGSKNVKGPTRKISAMLAAIVILPIFLSIGGVRAHAVPDAVLRASGEIPAAKTERTVKLEKELEKLAAKEKSLKDQIAATAINRSKLLAQKRADLKLIRQNRDDSIRKDIEKIKEKKDRQNLIIRELKDQLSLIKKTKNKVAITTLEVSIRMAQVKLTEINADLKIANGKLSQSYKDYKAVYDRLTYLDNELKAILDLGAEVENKIKDQKADFKNTRNEFNEHMKKKDFISAERKMESLIFIQTGINDNYVLVLDYRQRFKSDYYALIVNYKL